MKKAVFCNVVRSNFTRIFAMAGLIAFMGGCAGPRMLQDRDAIPPATMLPVPEGVQQAGDNDLSLPVVAPNEEVAISQDNQQTEYPGFPSVKTKTISYKVRKGDSFWKIARMYGVGMKELAAYNNMDLKKTLLAGKTIQIPPGGKLIPESQLAPIKMQRNVEKTSPNTAIATDGTYTVKSGDSLWVIARNHNTTINKIIEVNGITKSAPLNVGQKLVMPESTKVVEKVDVAKKAVHTPKAAQAVPLSKADNDLLNELVDNQKDAQGSSVDTVVAQTKESFLPHTVKEGDDWNTLSEMYGISLNDLKKANPKVASEEQPGVGTVINIPEE